MLFQNEGSFQAVIETRNIGFELIFLSLCHICCAVQLFKEDHMYKPPKLLQMLSYQNIYPLEGGDKLMKTNNVDGVV